MKEETSQYEQRGMSKVESDGHVEETSQYRPRVLLFDFYAEVSND